MKNRPVIEDEHMELRAHLLERANVLQDLLKRYNKNGVLIKRMKEDIANNLELMDEREELLDKLRKDRERAENPPEQTTEEINKAELIDEIKNLEDRLRSLLEERAKLQARVDELEIDQSA